MLYLTHLYSYECGMTLVLIIHFYHKSSIINSRRTFKKRPLFACRGRKLNENDFKAVEAHATNICKEKFGGRCWLKGPRGQPRDLL